MDGRRGGGRAGGAGGIHIAPALGEERALAVLAGAVLMFDRARAPYGWLIAGLLFVALQRANQAVLFRTQIESVFAFDLLINVLVLPLLLGVWTMAWWTWLRPRRPAWMPGVTAALTLLYMGAQWLGRSWFPLGSVHRFSGSIHTAAADLRLGFAASMLLVAAWGARRGGHEAWLALPAMALLAVGLFAPEISGLHVRSIWFLFGTGVSRTQFAYVGFDAALFVLLWRRLSFFAKAARRAPG